MSPYAPNGTLPPVLSDQVFSSVQALLFVNSVTLFISLVALAMGTVGFWEARFEMKKTPWRVLLFKDSFHVRV